MSQALLLMQHMKNQFLFLRGTGGTVTLLRLATFTGYPGELENIPLPYGNSANESMYLGQCANIELMASNVLNVKCYSEGGSIGQHTFVHKMLCDYFCLYNPETQPIPSMDMDFVLPQTKKAINEQLEKVEKTTETLLQEIHDDYERAREVAQKVGQSPEELEQKKLEKLEYESYVQLVAEDIRKLVTGERDQW